jgi:hypothetical protein
VLVTGLLLYWCLKPWQPQQWNIATTMTACGQLAAFFALPKLPCFTAVETTNAVIKCCTAALFANICLVHQVLHAWQAHQQDCSCNLPQWKHEAPASPTRMSSRHLAQKCFGNAII